MKQFEALVVSAALVLALTLSGCGSTAGNVRIPMESEGEKYTLDAALYLPNGNKGPFPVVILNHGAGAGAPGVSAWPYGQAPVDVFLESGFAVLLPMRSGYGASGGRNHEPVTNARGTYSTGLNHAKRDLDAVFKYVKQAPSLDASRIILAGQSRGGLLSVVYASAVANANVKGVINFAGNWWGTYGVDYHRETFEKAGSGYKVPNLWLYGRGDEYSPDYAIELYHSRFKWAGGDVEFKFYPQGVGGHFIVSNPSVWKNDVQTFLKRTVK